MQGLLMVGDARLERAAFGSGELRHTFTSYYLTLPRCKLEALIDNILQTTVFY
jgi:hypothetical protein